MREPLLPKVHELSGCVPEPALPGPRAPVAGGDGPCAPLPGSSFHRLTVCRSPQKV